MVAGAPPTLGAEGQGAQVRGQTLALRAEFSISRTRTVGGVGGWTAPVPHPPQSWRPRWALGPDVREVEEDPDAEDRLGWPTPGAGPGPSRILEEITGTRGDAGEEALGKAPPGGHLGTCPEPEGLGSGAESPVMAPPRTAWNVQQQRGRCPVAEEGAVDSGRVGSGCPGPAGWLESEGKGRGGRGCFQSGWGELCAQWGRCAVGAHRDRAQGPRGPWPLR